MKVTKKSKKEDAVSFKKDPESSSKLDLLSPRMCFDFSTESAFEKAAKLDTLKKQSHGSADQIPNVKLEPSLLVMPLCQESEQQAKGPPSYTKKIWKINRFKSEEAEKQSKLIQDAQNLVMKDSSAKTNKHGFRKTNIKPKVNKEGNPKEFLFVNCTPTASSDVPAEASEDDKKVSAGPGRVSRLFRSRSLKREEKSKEQQLEAPRMVQPDVHKDDRAAKMPFLTTSLPVLAGPDTSKKPSLRRLYTRKPKLDLRKSGETSSITTPSEFSLTPSSATAASSTFTPITPILSTSSSAVSMVSGSTPQPEYFFGPGTYSTPAPSNAVLGTRDRSDSGDSMFQQVHNKQVLASPMVVTPYQQDDDDLPGGQESGYEDLVAVSPVSTSMTKKMKTLRRSNSIVSVTSASSQSQYAPSSLSSSGYYGLGVAFSPTNPAPGTGSNRYALRNRSVSNAAMTTQKIPLMKTHSHQNMSIPSRHYAEPPHFGPNVPLFDPQFINHPDNDPSRQQHIDAQFQPVHAPPPDMVYQQSLSLEELKKQHDDLIQQHESTFYSFGPINQDINKGASTQVPQSYQSAAFRPTHRPLTSLSKDITPPKQDDAEEETFDLYSFLNGNFHERW
ncbi:hypothetical protein OGAPHI_003711 [Ogataea philodendri]|uniref:Uncharacterized protein n=1 Tax=Ogataea philodendri TaxID=1378263 RepID=A0A9P8T4X9_9ASCO|nr:uncharacterized protein OGAPHI_003711 [Ogataea philodendri]KAH3665525.1 hypothetical protein OGAPHI_003711 [Ogataea philodendri]